MKNSLQKFTLAVVASLLVSSGLFAATVTATATATLTVTVANEASLTVGGTTNLTTAVTNFSTAYTSATPTNISYLVRTSKTGGSGGITVYISSDFVGGAGGVGPLAANGVLSYTCTGTGTGVTPCASSTVAKTTAGTATAVLTFVTDTHSANGGNTAATSWSLQDLPSYQTDTYTATATYTISST